MSERIENLKYTKDDDGQATQGAPFFNGPAEFLIAAIVEALKAVPQWAAIFGDNIDPYKRMDYSIRSLPGLRVYNNIATKEFESWFVEGDVIADIILPASVRRNELQQVQDTLSMALLQQFRRPEFFDLMGQKVPGLNELGKRFSADKTLGFQWEDNLVPLTQITINFRLDLRIWDEYLEQTNRTKDSPFVAVLKNLETIASTIKGLNDDESQNVAVQLEQNTT